MNSSGQLVSQLRCLVASSNPEKPWDFGEFTFTWSENSGSRLIGNLKLMGSFPWDINDQGDYLLDGSTTGLLGLSIFDKNSLPIYELSCESCIYIMPRSINNSGSLLYRRYEYIDSKYTRSAIIRKSDGSETTLPTAMASAYEFNESDEVVTNGRRWSPLGGVVDQPSDYPIFTWIRINEGGDAAGYRYESLDPPANTISSAVRSAIWHRDGSITPIKDLPGFDGSLIYFMNDHGIGVGHSENFPNDGNTAAQEKFAATVWIDSEPYNLNNLILSNPNIHLTWARDINESGIILAEGYSTTEPLATQPQVFDPTFSTDSYYIYDPNATERRIYNYILTPSPNVGPPSVTPVLTGQIGGGNFYLSDVSLKWEIDSHGLPLTTSSGCFDSVVAEDTKGISFGCTATSAGGTTTESVTIKRDATAPTATATATPLANSAGWNNGSVSVEFTGTDATSGIASCSANDLTITEGENQTSGAGTCTDVAGNVSAPVSYSSINIDMTPPSVSALRSPAANGAGWNNTAVTVSYSALDALSGVAADGCSAPNTLVTNGSGQAATGTCIDRAGNSASVSVSGVNIDLLPPIATAVVTPAANVASWHKAPVTISFVGTDSLTGSGVASCSANSVVGTDGAGQPRSGSCTDLAGNNSAATAATVNLDQSAPTITLTTPSNSATYTQNAIVNSAFSCADALSGVASCIGTVPSGTALSTSNLGANSFTVQSTDVAGNGSTQTVPYTVVAPIPFTISSTALAFGNQALNTSTAQVVTLRNNTGSVLALTAPTLSGKNSKEFALARTCGTSLAANTSCTITVTFKPTAAGAKTAAFSLRIGTTTQAVALSGAGVAATYTLSPTALTFPNTTRNITSVSQRVTVANTSNVAMPLTTIALGGTNANQFVKTQTCGTILAASSSCFVDVAFKPTSAGSKSATLTVTPGGGAAAKSATLKGSGL